MSACLEHENHTGQRPGLLNYHHHDHGSTSSFSLDSVIDDDGNNNNNIGGLTHHDDDSNRQRRSTPLLIRTSSGQQKQKHRRPATNVPPSQPLTNLNDRRSTALSTFRANSNISTRKANILNSISGTNCNTFNNCQDFNVSKQLPTSANKPIESSNKPADVNNNSSSLSYPIERNSLESIHSKFSLSSANEQPITTIQPLLDVELSSSVIQINDHQHQHNQQFQSKPAALLKYSIIDANVEQNGSGVELSAFTPVSQSCDSISNQPRPISSNVALVATRYVSPPNVDYKINATQNLDNQLQQVASGSKCCWRNIPLDEGRQQCDYNYHHHHNYLSGQPDSRQQQLDGAFESTTAVDSKAKNYKTTQQNDRVRSPSTPIDNKRKSIISKSSFTDKELILMGSKCQKQQSPADSKPRKIKDLDGDVISHQSAIRGGRGPNNVAPFPFAGILASILGSVFFSISVLCIKLLPDDHDSGIVEKIKALFIRGCCFMVLCGTTIIVQRSTFLIRRDELLVNVLRSVFGFMGVLGLYISLMYISLGDANALVFSSPIWTSILSHFILKEPFHLIQILALPASMFGILLIAHPALIIKMDHVGGDFERQPILLVPENVTTTMAPQIVTFASVGNLINQIVMDVTNVTNANDLLTSEQDQSIALNSTTVSYNHHNLQQQQQQQHLIPIVADLDSATMSSESSDFEHRWPGVVIALCTSFVVSIVYIVLKFRKTTPIQTTTFWLGFTLSAFSLLVMCFVGIPSMPGSVYEWTLLIGNGFLSWLGQALIQWALMHEDASILSVVRTLDVAMTFTLSAIFLEEEILWTSIVGATIIGLVVVSIVMNSWIQGVLKTRAAERRDQDQDDASAADGCEANRTNYRDDSTSIKELNVIVVSDGCEEKKKQPPEEPEKHWTVAMELSTPTRRNTSAAA